jgi:Zn-dependent protease
MIAISVIFVLVVIPAIVLHEWAHAWAADKLGDPTAREMGRLSLNPLRHVDPVGTILLPLLLYLPYAFHWTHSPIIFGFAKPVPFDPRRLNDPRRGIMLVRLAGPAMNVLLAFFFAKVAGVLPLTLLGEIAVAAVFLNLGLAVFNMLPIPPLDGSGLLYVILPPRMHGILSRLDNMTGIVIVFIMLNMGWLNFLNGIIYNAAHWMGVRG